MLTMKNTAWTLVFALLPVTMQTESLSAQNPLRQSNDSFQWQSNQPRDRALQAAPAQQNNRQRANQPASLKAQPQAHTHAQSQPIVHQVKRIPRQDPFTSSQSSQRPTIELTNYQEPASAGTPSRSKRVNSNQTLVASTDKLPWLDPNKILDLIMNISLNLAFVLSFAFGAILLAKRWMNPNSSVANGDRLGSDTLTVLQTLRMEPKISIRLVQWRSNRFLVACDQNGIQSVNVLNGSFDQTLTELEAEDQIVSKLLPLGITGK